MSIFCPNAVFSYCPIYSGPTPTQEGGDCYYYEFTGWSPSPYEMWVNEDKVKYTVPINFRLQ